MATIFEVQFLRELIPPIKRIPVRRGLHAKQFGTVCLQIELVIPSCSDASNLLPAYQRAASPAPVLLFKNCYADGDGLTPGIRELGPTCLKFTGRFYAPGHERSITLELYAIKLEFHAAHVWLLCLLSPKPSLAILFMAA